MLSSFVFRTKLRRVQQKAIETPSIEIDTETSSIDI
jgi:hypothetical protein